MGHFLSRAIKRFTQCNSNTRNQLVEPNQAHATNQEQQATVEREDTLAGRFSSESIPVGQSIDSTEYTAFKTAPSSIDKNKDNLTSTSHVSEQADSFKELKDDNQSDERGLDATGGESTQSRPQVEEAVIKIQALVRGHLTRKALKDAHHQAVPLNVLGQSQFDEESLRSPPNVLFSNVPPQSTNTSNLASAGDNQLQQQSGSKLGNGRVPPLESIAEDVESNNATASTSTRVKRKLSSPRNQTANSASETSGESLESQSTSPSNEANASIDIHCDMPTSASIDIMDHWNRPLDAMASVLHPQTAPRASAEVESTTTTANDQSDQLTGGDNSNNNVELQNGSGRLGPSMSMLLNDQAHPMSAGSVPSTPPHINLALTTNSHSIDSAEAAAIRIQSAFRGYHTRKHSPYRRRSPGDVGSSMSNVAPINGAISNGQPKRSTLRQQNATILDDEELIGEETEENRQSRLRHRLDEAHPGSGDLAHDTPSSRATESMYVDLEQTTPAADDDQKTMTARAVQPGESAPLPSVLSSDIANRLTSADQLSQERLLPARSDRTIEAFSLDTDSSNLGAALSMNEDLSEGLSQVSIGGDANGQVPLKRDSLGAALESSSDETPSVADQDDMSREQVVKKQLEELDRVTDQLEAALGEATDNEALTYGEEITPSVVVERGSADESQQNLNELESDDIERRHPSGFVDEASRSCSQDQEQQAALVASSSLDDQEVDIRNEQQLAQLVIPQARSEAISPDEAIGSGESSPALVESPDGNSTDDGVDSDQEQDGQPRESGTTRADNQQSSGGANKGGKKRRNRRRGKK